MPASTVAEVSATSGTTLRNDIPALGPDKPDEHRHLVYSCPQLLTITQQLLTLKVECVFASTDAGREVR
jgi:hypothetical protein